MNLSKGCKKWIWCLYDHFDYYILIYIIKVYIGGVKWRQGSEEGRCILNVPKTFASAEKTKILKAWKRFRGDDKKVVFQLALQIFSITTTKCPIIYVVQKKKKHIFFFMKISHKSVTEKMIDDGNKDQIYMKRCLINLLAKVWFL